MKMKKLIQNLPSNWLYQLISLALITPFTFYIFQSADRFEIVREFWESNDKLYIYTFLGIQFTVKILFYWGLFLVFKKVLFGKIRDKVISALNEPKTKEDLKIILEIKQFIVQIFGVPIQFGLLEKEDLNIKIEMTNEELEETMTSIGKWFCVFIHFAFTSILVWQLSAYYIVPLLIVVLCALVLYWFGITLLFGNITLIEKARKEVVGQKTLKI